MFVLGGTPLPLPLSTVGASYGLGERYDVDGHLHVTSALFNVAGLDVGGSYLLLPEKWPAPALSASARVYGFSDFRTGTRAYLELTAAGSYLFKDRFLTYLSATSFLQLQGRPIFAVAAGEEVSLGAVGLQLEWRWYGMNRDMRYSAVDWLSIGPLGAWGVVLGARYRFGAST